MQLPWFAWMALGALAIVASFIAVAWIEFTIRDRAAVRKRQIAAQRSSAERDMQKVVQKTISQMFAAARERS